MMPAQSTHAEPEPASTPAVKELHLGWTDRVGDAVFAILARLGIGPASLLTTTGRRTGRPRSTPVIPVRQPGHLWLVAPYGDVSWVLNARATGKVVLRSGRQTLTYTIREVLAAEAGPILKRYVSIASATRPYFRADTEAPASEFTAEADLHPVFELVDHWGDGRHHVIGDDDGVSEWRLTGTLFDGSRIDVPGRDFLTTRDDKILRKKAFRKQRPLLTG